jgi:putative ABC transport system substrate-binding protein
MRKRSYLSQFFCALAREDDKMNDCGSLKPVAASALVVLCALLFAAGARAAQPMSVIGVLTPGMIYDPILEGLRQGLEKFGYREGRDLRIVVEDSQGDMVNLNFRAAKLMESKPDVIFTITTGPTKVARQATAAIPIVFTVVGDPVQAGLVASFASSRNNVTGVSSYSAPLSGKRLALLKEIAPKTREVLAIVSARENSAQITAQFLEEAARRMGIQVQRRDVTKPDEIEKALVGKPVTTDAIFHVASVLVGSNIEALIATSRKDRLPLMVNQESMVRDGALASYGADFRLSGIQAAKLVAKLLKGAKPSDIPIETPESLVLAINVTVARAIGLKIPRNVLERVDRLLD